MRIHSFESEVDKLQVRLDKALTEKDKLEAKLEYSQSELGRSKAEIDKHEKVRTDLVSESERSKQAQLL